MNQGLMKVLRYTPTSRMSRAGSLRYHIVGVGGKPWIGDTGKELNDSMYSYPSYA